MADESVDQAMDRAIYDNHRPYLDIRTFRAWDTARKDPCVHWLSGTDIQRALARLPLADRWHKLRNPTGTQLVVEPGALAAVIPRNMADMNKKRREAFSRQVRTLLGGADSSVFRSWDAASDVEIFLPLNVDDSHWVAIYLKYSFREEQKAGGAGLRPVRSMHVFDSLERRQGTTTSMGEGSRLYPLALFVRTADKVATDQLEKTLGASLRKLASYNKFKIQQDASQCGPFVVAFAYAALVYKTPTLLSSLQGYNERNGASDVLNTRVKQFLRSRLYRFPGSGVDDTYAEQMAGWPEEKKTAFFDTFVDRNNIMVASNERLCCARRSCRNIAARAQKALPAT